jgi:DoxX-like family
MPKTPLIDKLAPIFIGSVWIFHGLYSKILDGIPRHKLIVGRILGESFADIATLMIGVMEILLGCWVIWGKHRKINASIQTLGLVSMNTLEIILAKDLLISAAGMVALNLCFIALIWWWATRENHFNQSN